ncbi:MAG: glycosyltransferase [Candidatus Heimdallarchaeota archaeon]|nr:glycosyltransferase [Candidatus Heimdallarchaeota archaeon]
MSSPNPGSETTVIIPTLNEEKNIENMITQLLGYYPGISVIVADDGSKDKTGTIVSDFHAKNELIRFLDRKDEEIKGLTISLIDALEITQTRYFVVIDSDFQHPPEKIGEGIKLFDTGSQLIIGTRTSVEGWGLKRKIISWGATTLGKISLFLRRRPRPKDIMSGFFGGQTEYVNTIIRNHPKTISPRGYKLLFDILKVLPRDTQIGEYYYEFQTRQAGESKIGLKHILVYFRSLF